MGHDISKPAGECGANLGINMVVAQDTWHPDKSFMLEFKGKDESYGKPPEGSLTEARAQRACQHINKELTTLLSVIRGIGTQDETTLQTTVTFGKLFRYYIPISNKIVGLLLRARRWKLVNFPGEMLYQGQDNEVIIQLIAGDSIIPYSRRFDFSLDGPCPTETLAINTDKTVMSVGECSSLSIDLSLSAPEHRPEEFAEWAICSKEDAPNRL